MSSFDDLTGETVPDRRCSIRKISDQASACTEREDRDERIRKRARFVNCEEFS